jgi:ComF family protein
VNWRRWLSICANAALPWHCALCGMAATGHLCAPCHADFVAPQRPRCHQCANPLEEAQPACGRCLAARPAYDATVAAFDYAPPLDQLVLQLKFAANLALARWCAQALADAVVAAGHDPLLPDVLCPVPLGERRLVERGFNQALEIARPLGRALGVPVQARWAVRRVETRAQSSVAPRERAANLRRAFTLAPQAVALVPGLHVGLVDDVMTSGHTLGELAATFKRFGAARVTNYVAARTPPE